MTIPLISVRVYHAISNRAVFYVLLYQFVSFVSVSREKSLRLDEVRTASILGMKHDVLVCVEVFISSGIPHYHFFGEPYIDIVIQRELDELQTPRILLQLDSLHWFVVELGL